MINRILIANRGEIACRIIDTAKRLGLTTIAVYSTADQTSRHVRLADEAYCIGDPDSRHSYLNQNKIITVAKQARADAIHPGYGFLAENADFATLCEKNSIIFIGPAANIISLMGDKAAAKNHLSDYNVPLIPGYSGDDQSSKLLLQEAKKIGFPVLLKAACGGGGKGMRIVNSETEFIDNLQRAQQEAKASFGDNRIIIEKYLLNPRHIEVQVFSDQHGNHLHLFERDCSIQRRHQKIIEEAPAPGITQALRDKLTNAALTITKAINYTGAGTVEFLTDDAEQCYFMEMNTRLQVEHPVTEMITGIDMVAWQIIVADGNPLPLTQDQIIMHGHAIEVRLYAEDPNNQFLPSIGDLNECRFPNHDQSIRIYTGVTIGSSISQYYDPMIAKLAVATASRESTINKAIQALQQCYLLGVKTNVVFLQQILNHTHFKKAQLSTDFLNQHELASIPSPDINQLLSWAALGFYLQSQKTALAGFKNWRLNHLEAIEYNLIFDQQHFKCMLQPSKDSIEITCNGNTIKLIGQYHDCTLIINDTHQIHTMHAIFHQGLHLWYQGQVFHFTQQQFDSIDQDSDTNDNQVSAPMPGTIVTVHVATGDTVCKGDKLLVMEAMKMQHTLIAPRDGVVKTLFCEQGEFVKENTELVELT